MSIILPSWENYNKLIKKIEKGKIKKNSRNLKIHENWRRKAFQYFENLENPKVKSALGKKYTVLRKGWRSCLTSLKYNPDALDVWELYGDTSYELGQTGMAITIYKKSLELHPENEDQIRTKISQATKIHNLIIAMETGMLPLDVVYKYLKCINCGTSETLRTYIDRKTYTTGPPIKQRITSTIIVPLCKRCSSSAKYNARRNLKYGVNGASVKARGSQLGISINQWIRLVLLEKYKVGLLDDALFSAIPFI